MPVVDLPEEEERARAVATIDAWAERWQRMPVYGARFP